MRVNIRQRASGRTLVVVWNRIGKNRGSAQPVAIRREGDTWKIRKDDSHEVSKS
jgi:hypothetical protein